MAMMEQVLRLVAEGGVHSYNDLARQLSIPEPLLEAMLEDLARLGYLRAVDSGCGDGCHACPIARSARVGGCSVAGPGRQLRAWTLTEKGVGAFGGL